MACKQAFVLIVFRLTPAWTDVSGGFVPAKAFGVGGGEELGGISWCPAGPLFHLVFVGAVFFLRV
jgi:hypothetical protein